METVRTNIRYNDENTIRIRLQTEFSTTRYIQKERPLEVNGDGYFATGDIGICDDNYQKLSFLSWAADNYRRWSSFLANYEFYGFNLAHANGGARIRSAWIMYAITNAVVTIGKHDLLLSTPVVPDQFNDSYATESAVTDFKRIKFNAVRSWTGYISKWRILQVFQTSWTYILRTALRNILS